MSSRLCRKREYKQMVEWDRQTQARPTTPDLSTYRLGQDAFFFKVYPNPLGAPPPAGLLKGMYFPLSYWSPLIASPGVRGPRGGVQITYKNAERYLTNTQFTDLVGRGWVGSSSQDERMFVDVIEQSLSASHSITLAVAQPA